MECRLLHNLQRFVTDRADAYAKGAARSRSAAAAAAGVDDVDVDDDVAAPLEKPHMQCDALGPDKEGLEMLCDQTAGSLTCHGRLETSSPAAWRHTRLAGCAWSRASIRRAERLATTQRHREIARSDPARRNPSAPHSKIRGGVVEDEERLLEASVSGHVRDLHVTTVCHMPWVICRHWYEEWREFDDMLYCAMLCCAGSGQAESSQARVEATGKLTIGNVWVSTPIPLKLHLLVSANTCARWAGE